MSISTRPGPLLAGRVRCRRRLAGRIGARLLGMSTARPLSALSEGEPVARFRRHRPNAFGTVVLPASFGATSLEVGAASSQRCRRMSACSPLPTTRLTSMGRTVKRSRAISVFGSHGSKPSHDPWQGSKDRCITAHDGDSRPKKCHILAHPGTRSNVSSSREHRTFLTSSGFSRMTRRRSSLSWRQYEPRAMGARIGGRPTSGARKAAPGNVTRPTFAPPVSIMHQPARDVP